MDDIKQALKSLGDLVSLEEAAGPAGYKLNSLRQLVYSGRAPSVQIGRSRFVRVADLMARRKIVGKGGGSKPKAARAMTKQEAAS